MVEQYIIDNNEIWTDGLHESCGYLSQFPNKKNNGLILTSITWDMGWTSNIVWVAW